MAGESSKYTFKLSQKEEEKREFLVKYSVARDEYLRISITEGEEKEEMLLKGWQAGVHSARNIFRKHEKDWKFVYLARTGEGRNFAVKQYISWIVLFSEYISYSLCTVAIGMNSLTFYCFEGS